MATRTATTTTISKAVPRAAAAPRAKAARPAATKRQPQSSAEIAPSERRIVETAQEARSGEPGPSVLALLTISTVAAGFVLGILWFVFFRT